MNSSLIKCPRCRAINTFQTPYFQCYNCYYIDKDDISYQVNEIEKEQRVKVKEIINYLFSNLLSPTINFPEENIHPVNGNACWGWAEENTIFIPRKSFYLPSEELVDLIVHEASHLLAKERIHGRSWYFCYRRNREKVFNHYSNFVNWTNPQARFKKGYEIYPSRYQIEYEEKD